MLPVRLADEPEDFNSKVREPGNRAIQEMIDPALAPRRPGPRRKVYGHLDSIPPSALPDLWTRALDDMCGAYDRICAYLGMRIPLAVGQPTVDHFVPKSLAPELAYEWSNFRLASLTANRLKDAAAEFVDPCSMAIRCFELDFARYEVRWVGPQHAASPMAISNTLTVLNEPTCCDAREDHHGWYLGIPDKSGRPRDRRSYAWLASESPFVAAELVRQGRL